MNNNNNDNDIDNNNNNNNYNKIEEEEDDGGEFSDSDNEWGDIATPRRLVDSTANTKNLVHVPPLDLKRALSAESGKKVKVVSVISV